MTNDTQTTSPAVYAAFAAAMTEVEKIAKLGENKHQRFNFRGIDDTMNAVGPVFREHGLFIIPEVVDKQVDHAATNAGKRMTTVHLQVRYTIAHKDGSSFAGTAPGEANDTSDKSTAKAMSVALRTFLLQSMLIPTGDPDPDTYYDSAAASPRAGAPAVDYKKINMHSATRQQLLDAMQAAQRAGDSEAFESIRKAGAERFGS